MKDEQPKSEKVKVVQRFELTDALWERLQAVLPPEPVKTTLRGRPAADPRKVANAIFFVLRTGCQWKAVRVESHGVSGSTAHRYFQQWQQSGAFFQFWGAALKEYELSQGIGWTWQSMDGAMTKAPLGGIMWVPIPLTERNRAPNARS